MIIDTKNALKAIGPYVQAVSAGSLLFISGCCPFRPEDGSVNGDNIELQTKQTMDNLKAIIESAGLGIDDIVKTTCFISNMNNFSQFNLVYSGYFSPETYPARSCVEVSRLPKDILIEIEAIAVIK
ncbi:RidA family protein [Salmonella enterica]|nr:RidA family protein [Salmonella enterica]EJG3990383.1 RidA family protein [Salmonella enterica]